MKVAFRVDSGSQLGSGHLIRCLTLAKQLKLGGADVLFISREFSGNLIEKIEQSALPVCRLASPHPYMFNSEDYSTWLGVTQEDDASQTVEALDNQIYDWIIIDHYGIDEVWEKAVRPFTHKILVIDDLANRNHDCDVLLDQNYFGDKTLSRYQNLVSEHCKCLLGPNFALLQPEYAQLTALMPSRDGQIARVLVFFGGSDISAQTAKVLSALSHTDLLHLAVDVVAGPNYSDYERIKDLVLNRPGTTLHRNLPTLAGLMMRADLMIGAGGATTWERMCLGLPSLVISVAENQDAPTRSLTTDGYQKSINEGVNASIILWQRAILQLIKDQESIISLSKKSGDLVDGVGAKRIARILLNLEMPGINTRLLSHSDESLLYRWANESETRKQSFNQKPISKEEHAQWFARKLRDPDSHILISEDNNGLALGLVRFDVDRSGEAALISISIDHGLRGLGFSVKLLKKALQYWRSVAPNLKLIAEIRETNWRSQRLFQQLNFKAVHSDRVGAVTFELEPLGNQIEVDN